MIFYINIGIKIGKDVASNWLKEIEETRHMIEAPNTSSENHLTSEEPESGIRQSETPLLPLDSSRDSRKHIGSSYRRWSV